MGAQGEDLYGTFPDICKELFVGQSVTSTRVDVFL